jgi:hypothetical protein
MGYKVKGGDNDVFLFPFKGNQAWNIPKATKLGPFHWPPSWGLPSPPSFSFSLKTRI